MFIIYQCFSLLIGGLIKVIGLFNPKMKLFVQGRKQSFKILADQINAEDKVIWFHTASMGEYEQGLPLIQETRKKFPHHKILLTFFSPSGYEHLKDKAEADVVCYLPWDTYGNSKKFLKLAHPEMALFVKYEFWPFYIKQLHQLNIPILLVSGIFRKKHIFFKPHGGFMRKMLRSFDHFFVQDQNSKNLLESINLQNITISGDTRFDRVLDILERDNRLDFIEDFKNNQLCVVAGSTWPEDEKWLLPIINKYKKDIKFIIAPHNIKPKLIAEIGQQLQLKHINYTQRDSGNLADYPVLILDTIGLLTKVYSYADIAYVGGGVGPTGLHNTLEPAVFGTPLVIGPKYTGFKEAEDLVQLQGIKSCTNAKELKEELDQLIKDKNYRLQRGTICKNYVQESGGATSTIISFLKEILQAI